MRILCILALLASAGCGNGSSGGDDMSASVDGGMDIAVSHDLIGCNRIFGGFIGPQTTPTSFQCPCGCTIDSMEGGAVNPIWNATHTSKSSFSPVAGVGLGFMLAYDGTNKPESASLDSAGPSAQFFLDGDFDMLISYDLGTTPPGEAHVVLGLRDAAATGGSVYNVERVQLADGTNQYASTLAGSQLLPLATTATHGVLRITRQGARYRSYGDAQAIGTVVGPSSGRVAVTVSGVLAGCSLGDAGNPSCAFQPRVFLLRLANGTLVNLPQ